MHRRIFFDKSRDGKSRMVGRESVEPKNRIPNSTAPRSIPYQSRLGPPARELRSAMHAKRFEQCRCSFEIIMRPWAFRRRRATMKFAPPFAKWRENIIPMWRRIRRPPRKSLSRSTKRTRYWATRRSARSTINLARIGTNPGDFNRRPDGEGNSREEDSIGPAMTAGFNLSLAEPGSAISSRHFSVADVAGPLLADSVGGKRQLNAEAMSKRTLWSHSKKRCMDRRARFRCAVPVQTKQKVTKSRFRAAFTKVSASGWPARAKLEHAVGKAAICFCVCVWPDILIFPSKEAI